MQELPKNLFSLIAWLFKFHFYKTIAILVTIAVLIIFLISGVSFNSKYIDINKPSIKIEKLK